MQKDSRGMSFDAYAQRISSLKEFKNDVKEPNKMIQKRFQLLNTEMEIVSLKKAQFSGLNGQRYYFSDRIVPFPYGHSLLKPLRKENKN